MRWLFFFCLLVSSCISLDERLDPSHDETKSWNGQLYVGDNTRHSLIRSQSNSEIKCSDPIFSEMICMNQSDFKSLLEYSRRNRE